MCDSDRKSKAKLERKGSLTDSHSSTFHIRTLFDCHNTLSGLMGCYANPS